MKYQDTQTEEFQPRLRSVTDSLSPSREIFIKKPSQRSGPDIYRKCINNQQFTNSILHMRI